MYRAASDYKDQSSSLEIMPVNSCTTAFQRWTPCRQLDNARVGGHAIHITSG